MLIELFVQIHSLSLFIVVEAVVAFVLLLILLYFHNDLV